MVVSLSSNQLSNFVMTARLTFLLSIVVRHHVVQNEGSGQCTRTTRIGL